MTPPPSTTFDPAAPLPLHARLEALEAFSATREVWLRLERSSLDRNPFYNPDFLLPAAELSPGPGAIRILSAWEDRRLVGLLPLHRPSWRDGLPLGVIGAWWNRYVCLTTPLLARDCAAAAFRAMLSELDRCGGYDALSFPILPQELETGQLIARIAAEQQRRQRNLATYARASLAPRPGITFREYAEQESAAARKDFRRREARLLAHGAVEYSVLNTPGPEREQAIAQFLRLEASGWKGEQRSALGSSPETLRFVQQAFRQDSGLPYEIERLSVDGQAIAMSLNLIGGNTRYNFKQTYDQEWRGYAPGKMLDRRAIQRVLAAPAPIYYDSCALPGYPVDAIWHERLLIAHCLLGLGSAAQGRRLDRLAWLSTGLRKGMDQLRRWRETLRRRITTKKTRPETSRPEKTRAESEKDGSSE